MNCFSRAKAWGIVQNAVERHLLARLHAAAFHGRGLEEGLHLQRFGRGLVGGAD
jgi:hypothetical protein